MILKRKIQDAIEKTTSYIRRKFKQENVNEEIEIYIKQKKQMKANCRTKKQTNKYYKKTEH